MFVTIPPQISRPGISARWSRWTLCWGGSTGSHGGQRTCRENISKWWLTLWFLRFWNILSVKDEKPCEENAEKATDITDAPELSPHAPGTGSIQNGMYANLIFPPVLVIQGGLYLTLKSIVEIQLQCWKVLIFTILKHFFHPYLNWIAFSLSRPHCHKLSDARWWESKIDIMLLWTEQPWHWPTEATEKLREGWKGSSIHITRKNNQQQADCADWLWNRQTNGGDKIGNINALFMLYKA